MPSLPVSSGGQVADAASIEIIDPAADLLTLRPLPILSLPRHDPLFATFLLLGVQAVFKPYPTAGDVGVWMSLGFIFSDYTSCKLRARLPLTTQISSPRPLITLSAPAPQTSATPS